VPLVRSLLVGFILGQMANALDPEQQLSGSLILASAITFGLLVAAGIGFPIPEELPILGPVTGGQNTASNMTGVYSSSGFDMIGVLARISSR